MSVWLLVQGAINIVLLLGIFIIWSRLKRPPQEDPRLSKGLQLLQSKISVIEDLSDRTETMVQQLMRLLEQKVKQVQQKVMDSDAQLQRIEQAMVKSLEVAEIFQDKIPHQEIIERRNRLKYIQAARWAHQGMSVEEILSKVDLPRSEVEFIAKVNRDQLMFDEHSLPAWARDEWSIKEPQKQPITNTKIELPDIDLAQTQKLDKEFRRMAREHESKTPLHRKIKDTFTEKITDKILDHTEKILDLDEDKVEVVKTSNIVPSSYLKDTLNVNKDESKQVAETEIKKVKFPKLNLDINENLG